MKSLIAAATAVILIGLLIVVCISLHRAMSGTPSKRERRREARRALADGIRRGDRRAVTSVLIAHREDLPAEVIKDTEYWLVTGKSIHE